jgi:hypothetical protein
MKVFDWSELKNTLLKNERDVCFEDVIVAISCSNLIDVIEHHNSAKYPGQKIYVVKIDSYVYLVPFVENDERIFLKTIYPSRKLTKQYLKGEEQ